MNGINTNGSQSVSELLTLMMIFFISTVRRNKLSSSHKITRSEVENAATSWLRYANERYVVEVDVVDASTIPILTDFRSCRANLD